MIKNSKKHLIIQQENNDDLLEQGNISDVEKVDDLLLKQRLGIEFW